METETPPMDLVHLRREARTALELALVSFVPMELIDRLASAAGLLEALAELPADSPPARALVPSVTDRARSAIGAWRAWQSTHMKLA
jgi:hypothetical protein